MKKEYKLLSLYSNSIFVSRDVKFYESVFPFKMRIGQSNKSYDSSISWESFFYDKPTLPRLVNDDLGPGSVSDDHQSGGATTTHSKNKRDTNWTYTTHIEDAFVPQLDWTNSYKPDLIEEMSQDNIKLLESHSIGRSRSWRETCVPLNFNDYIVEDKYKHGIKNKVNYSHKTKETNVL